MGDNLDERWTPDVPCLIVSGVDGITTWDVPPDGRSVVALEKRRAPELHLVQNWFEQLKQLVPVD